ncbi:MAG: hypothetical protein JRJ11_13310, partial [Deltaproteobacteria bacterium]|nr:hypothetical protein [Deltaproteobacteria bacterium]
MDKRKIWFISIITFLFLVELGSQSFAGDSARSRATLSGLRGVHVKVERLRSEIVKDGLTRQQIEEDVKQKLNSAGIKILSDTEGLRQFANPYLYVNPSISK